MKLSDLSPDDVSLVSGSAPAPAAIRMSDLSPDDVKLVQSAPAQDGFWKQNAKTLVNSLPMIGGVAGGIIGTPADLAMGPAGTVGGAAIGGYLGTATKNLINRYLDPSNAPKTDMEAITSPIVGGAEQGIAQAAGEAVAPLFARGAQFVAEPISDALQSYAAKKAVTATGATGKQALKFAPSAGQELLDQGIVGFGNSQAKVAQKAADALEATGQKISSTLADLDKRGATVDQADIVNSLRKRATELSDDPAQYQVSDSLNRLADRIESTIQAKGGNTDIPLGRAEQTKRGFQASANYNSSPIDLSISKEAAGIYQKAVEDAATKFDPGAAKVFTEAKKQYGLLSPITDAAEKRAATVAQSPHGGLLDTAATIAGEGIGGIPGAIAAPIARRAIAPRVASTLAVSANTAGKMIAGAPSAAASAIPAAIQSQVPSAGVTPIGSGAGGMIELPAAAKSDATPVNRTPARGPDAWAQQGIANLGIKDADLSQRLMQDPKAKQLLIQASDLTPGSKAMKNIMNQIQKGWAQ